MGNDCCSGLRVRDLKDLSQPEDCEHTFKNKFPFILYDIKDFVNKLNTIKGTQSVFCDTEIIQIEQVMSKFASSDAQMIESWKNVPSLL